MILKSLVDIIGKEKRRKERAETAQMIAVGIGVTAVAGVVAGILIAPKSGKEIREDFKKRTVNAVEKIQDTVQKKAETMKDSVARVAQEVCNVIKDVHEKTESVHKDIKDGCHEVTEDIQKTAGNISNEINKPIKRGT